VDAVTALNFGPYRLAGPKGPLTRDGDEVVLRPKTLGVLWYLATHGGEIVEQGRLIAAVWPNRVVSPGVLGVSIRELRRVFDDDVREPRYIRTIHRHGYQFMPPVHAAMAIEAVLAGLDGSLVVGREAELHRLDAVYERACRGQRQLLFVTGEPGIGKSTLVRSWLQRSLEAADVWLGLGQCIDHAGAGEPYLPILEALNRLCRGAGRESVIAVLRRHAPGWLAQLPAAWTAAEREALLSAQPPADARQFQRELADALEALGAIRPVVLVLEDLHWCDDATVEVLAVLAGRPEAARLLLIGTLRPLEPTDGQPHALRSLRHELALHRQCAEEALTGLDRAEVGTYLALRLPAEAAGDLAETVYRRTAGQPLFLVHLTDYLVQTLDAPEAGPGSAAEPRTLSEAATGLPHSLRHLIEEQIERLDRTKQQVLDAASVAGAAFAAAAVAAALGLPDHEVETVCVRLGS